MREQRVLFSLFLLLCCLCTGEAAANDTNASNPAPEAATDAFSELGYGEVEDYGFGDNVYYYGDEYEAYYNYYGYYGDTAGDDYTMSEDDLNKSDCEEAEDGQATIKGPVKACSLTVSGADAVADKLEGGVDGVYEVKGCYGGRPKYMRANSPEGEGRVLWFSSMFDDWDISRGNDVDEGDIIVYGGEGTAQERPNFIPDEKWFLVSELSSAANSSDKDYTAITLHVACSDGSQLQRPQQTALRQPLLTNAEMDAKYQYIYERYSHRGDPDPSINFAMVVLMTMLGISVVVGAPYLIFRRKLGKDDGPAKSLASMLEAARKRRAGRML